MILALRHHSADVTINFHMNKYQNNETISLCSSLQLNNSLCFNWGFVSCSVKFMLTIQNFAFLFNCTPVGRTSDSMMVPT